MVVLGGRSEPWQVGRFSVFPSAVEGTKADHQVAQSGQVFRCIAGVGGRAIFAKGNISDVVERVLNGPVTPAERLDLSGVHFGGRAAGEEDFNFLGNATGLEMMSGAVDHCSLNGVRKARALRSDLEGIDLAGFMPAMGLVQSDVRREKKRRSRPWKGGRVFQRVWVDCL
jgi:hypothetical protein